MFIQRSIVHPGGERQWAVFSPCETYRYAMGLEWDCGRRVHFLLHNPSTATEMKLDPTVRMCFELAVAHGYGSMTIGNRLAGGRSSNPHDCATLNDPVGPLNDVFLRMLWNKSSDIVIAWGNCPIEASREARVWELLRQLDRPLWCLGRTQAGNPKHPGARGRHRPVLDRPWKPYPCPPLPTV